MSIVLTDKRLGWLLVEEGVLTDETLAKANAHMASARVPLKKAVIDLGIASEEDILGALISKYGYSHVRLSGISVDPAALDRLPEVKCRQYKVMPISIAENMLTLAICEPLDVTVLDELRSITRSDIMPVLAGEKDIEQAIERYYAHQLSMDSVLPGEDEVSVVHESEENEDANALSYQGGEDSPVVKLANYLVSTAIRDGASDIHVEPRSKMVGIRYRVDGNLVEKENIPKRMQNALVSRFKIMASLDIAEKRIPQDGRIKVNFEAKNFDLRVSTLPTKHGEKVVMRILDSSAVAVSVEDLGFEGQAGRDFRIALDRPQGMILVTGPTGSGKTTTLYAGLNYLNKTDVNITTVEDPVEYDLNRVNQVQINVDTGMTFTKALRAILRQDPDVVMVGEIRDSETLDIAIKAALTGHLVLSTLHTNDAPSTVIRILDMGMEPFLVASALEMVSAQRLLRKLCERCKQPVTDIAPEVLQEFKDVGVRSIDLFHAKGCERCNGTGYKGRLAVCEIMIMSDPLREMVVKRTSAEVLRAKAIELGMVSVRKNALAKAAKGITSYEEVSALTVL